MPESDDECTTPDADRQSKQSFDLEDRTARFGEDIIPFVKTLPDTAITHRLIDQIIRSATSVVANWRKGESK